MSTAPAGKSSESAAKSPGDVSADEPSTELPVFDHEDPTLPPQDATDHAAQMQLSETVVGPAMGKATGGAENPPGYKLMRILGKGGMGMVWEAEEEGTGRRVALKLLSPDLPNADGTVDRFLREAKSAASLSHPRSTFVFGAGEHEGQPYIVMELMPGKTLQNVVESEGTLPIARAVDYLLDVIEGLKAAHHLGIIHRDVKPSNCFMDTDGRVKVGDFGLSKSLISDASLTRTGAFLGTPQYAAPEQVRGEKVDRRTDVYATGATLFYLLTGRGPFTGDAVSVIAQIASDTAPSVRAVRSDIPKALDRIIAHSLARDPKDRYADLEQFQQALLPFATGGTSIADVGRRVAAFALDYILVFTVAVPVIVAAIEATLPVFGGLRPLKLVDPTAEGYVVTKSALFATKVALTLVYFTFAEGIWGRGLAKWLMGLRVVDAEGEPPGIAKALLRSLFLPGALGMSVVFMVWVYRSAEGLMELLPNPQLWQMIESGFQSAGMVIALLFLITMRTKNGFRGLHELASGTRVVRWRTKTAGVELNTPVTAPAVSDAAMAFGPFDAVGVIGRSLGRTILYGRDKMLERSVWICVNDTPGAAQPADAASTVTRPTRPRWLQGGVLEGSRWDAYEAIQGAPLSLAAYSTSTWVAIPWDQGRRVLSDLAEELAASAENNELPVDLSLEQVWVDRSGRVKLLEAPIEPLDAPLAPAKPPLGKDPAVSVLRSTAELCTQHQTLPGHAHEFLSALKQQPDEPQTLRWAADQLRKIRDLPATLKWDDRMGVLAVTIVTELQLMTLFCIGLPVFLGWLAASLSLRAAIALPIVIVTPFVLGAVFRGGPVFRFMGIEIRRPDGALASRLRCAWRSLLAWGPNCVFYCWVGLMIGASVMGDIAGDGSNSANSQDFAEAMILGLASCLLMPLMLLVPIGAILSVVMAKRGLQDIVARTVLTPK